MSNDGNDVGAHPPESNEAEAEQASSTQGPAEKTVSEKDDEVINLREDKPGKLLLTNRMLLGNILHYLVPEFAAWSPSYLAAYSIDKHILVGAAAVMPDDPDKSIEGLSTEDASVFEGTIYYDVLFGATVPETDCQICLTVNIELQQKDPGAKTLEPRKLLYLSREFARPLRKSSKVDYSVLRKVYGIWICCNVAKCKQNTIEVIRQAKTVHRFIKDGKVEAAETNASGKIRILGSRMI